MWNQLHYKADVSNLNDNFTERIGYIIYGVCYIFQWPKRDGLCKRLQFTAGCILQFNKFNCSLQNLFVRISPYSSKQKKNMHCSEVLRETIMKQF